MQVDVHRAGVGPEHRERKAWAPSGGWDSPAGPWRAAGLRFSKPHVCAVGFG